jgi:hypothetical protein
LKNSILVPGVSNVAVASRWTEYLRLEWTLSVLITRVLTIALQILGPTGCNCNVRDNGQVRGGNCSVAILKPCTYECPSGVILHKRTLPRISQPILKPFTPPTLPTAYYGLAFLLQPNEICECLASIANHFASQTARNGVRVGVAW